jgi:hypothetical protein
MTTQLPVQLLAFAAVQGLPVGRLAAEWATPESRGGTV